MNLNEQHEYDKLQEQLAEARDQILARDKEIDKTRDALHRLQQTKEVQEKVFIVILRDGRELAISGNAYGLQLDEQDVFRIINGNRVVAMFPSDTVMGIYAILNTSKLKDARASYYLGEEDVGD